MIQETTRTRVLQTRRGVVAMPAYMPVTTWGGEFPLDTIVRPFLRRHASCVMVSAHYAQSMPVDFGMPTFIDSGGFALLMPGAGMREREDGTAEIVRTLEDGSETVTSPEDVLALQLEKADLGATLDMPIPAGMTDQKERTRRVEMTLANALWASRQLPSGELHMFGSVQGWDVGSYQACAVALKDMGYRNLAIGGLVQRVSRRDELIEIVRGVAEVVAGEGLLHTFGIGEPRLARLLLGHGVTSTDSSSYVRSAVSERRWDGVPVPVGASPVERAAAALANLKHAVQVFSQEREDQGADSHAGEKQAPF